jgi:hypothetical protein
VYVFHEVCLVLYSLGLEYMRIKLIHYVAEQLVCQKDVHSQWDVDSLLALL